MTRQSSNYRPLSAVGINALQFQYFSLGLGISIVIHALCIVALSLFDFPIDMIICTFKPTVRIGPPVQNWTAPPAILQSTTPPVSRSREEGTPTPVPEKFVDNTIPTQHNMNSVGNPLETGAGGVEGAEAGSGPLELPIESPPEEFVPVEKNPVVIRSVVPKYPELALRAGLEGKVWLKIWVDKEGKPREVRLIKSDNDIFNEAAIEAAEQFLFTPAVMNNGPVSVWVALPFKFTLKAQ